MILGSSGDERTMGQTLCRNHRETVKNSIRQGFRASNQDIDSSCHYEHAIPYAGINSKYVHYLFINNNPLSP